MLTSIPKKVRKKRRTDPLKKKSKKLVRVKNLDDISLNKKESKGSDLIQRLNETKDDKTIVEDVKVPETSPNTDSDAYAGSIKNGVEVVDVKNIKDKKKLQ